MIRTFIAAEVNPETRVEIARDLGVLHRLAPRVKWSRPENLHLTFKFLGDLSEKDLDELFAAMRLVAEEYAPFALEVGGLGAFPHWRSPKVVWAGCRQGSDDAVSLATAIDQTCADLGYDPEPRTFSPHLTLGRVKLPADAEGLPEAVETLGSRDYGFIDVDEIIVFMSDLRRTGPVYAPMFKAKLSGSVLPPGID